jgi:hypothetical protein
LTPSSPTTPASSRRLPPSRMETSKPPPAAIEPGPRCPHPEEVVLQRFRFGVWPIRVRFGQKAARLGRFGFGSPPVATDSLSDLIDCLLVLAIAVSDHIACP